VVWAEDVMGRPTRAASAVWWAHALFCTAEQDSSEVKGVRGSGMLGMRVLEDLSVRLFWKASRRGSFGGSLSARRRSASASWARISLKTARWSFSIPKPKPVSGVSKTSFAGGGLGRWAAERAVSFAEQLPGGRKNKAQPSSTDKNCSQFVRFRRSVRRARR